MKISLEAARVNAQYSRAEVARLAGVTTQTVRNWEVGSSKPNNLEMESLARLYNIDEADIFLPSNKTNS